MKKMHAVVGGVVALVLAGTSAWAGMKAGNQGVTIDTTNRWASGSLGGARNSADANQHIGCRVIGYSVGVATATCYANDATNSTTVTCSSTVASVVQAAATVSDSSWVRFDWDANGNCTTVNVYNNSYFEPK